MIGREGDVRADGFASPRRGVALVSMPFHLCELPPIGLGLLKAALSSGGLRSTIYNLNLDMLPELGDTTETALGLYTTFKLGRPAVLGEWLFAPPHAERDEQYLARLPDCGFEPEQVSLVRRLRARVPILLARWAHRVVDGGHDIVGFSTSLERTRASVRLAEEIRRLAPDTRVLLGGFGATGDMGCALLEAFPSVDLVCHTEADELIVPIVRALRGEPDCSLEALRGISYRVGDCLVTQKDGAKLPELEEVPLPDFDDYFEQVEALRSSWDTKLDLPRCLPIETARGCWWGARRQCTFCGLNGDRMAFRAKSADRVLRDLEALQRRFGVTTFQAVDNVLSNDYFDTLLPRLAELRKGYVLSWEVRPNLTRAKLATMKRAGICNVQPGLESLSTPALRLLGKGTSAIDNIQMLKWSAANEIETGWNFLFSFPGEQVAWYEDVARLIPRLRHLSPPKGLFRVSVHRFSPYYTRASELGVKVLGPNFFTSLAFGEVSRDLVRRFTYNFHHELEHRPADADARIRAMLEPLIAAWRESFEKHGCTLSLLEAASESLLVEGPLLQPERIYRLNGLLLRLLRGCESIRSEHLLRAELAASERTGTPEAPLTVGGYRDILEALCFFGVRPEKAPEATLSNVVEVAEERGWVYRESGRILSLPVNQTRFVQTLGFQYQAALRRYE